MLHPSLFLDKEQLKNTLKNTFNESKLHTVNTKKLYQGKYQIYTEVNIYQGKVRKLTKESGAEEKRNDLFTCPYFTGACFFLW